MFEGRIGDTCKINITLSPMSNLLTRERIFVSKNSPIILFEKYFVTDQTIYKFYYIEKMKFFYLYESMTPGFENDLRTVVEVL